jgi:hypothetical protein
VKPFGIILMLIAFGMLIGGFYDSHDLRWEFPDATERRLWIDHSDRLMMQCGLLFGGFVVGFIGYLLMALDNRRY